MDQLVELERIDRCRIGPCEAITNVVEQPPKLLLVITPDALTGSPPLGAIIVGAHALVPVPRPRDRSHASRICRG